MIITLIQYIFSIVSGFLVGFSLGLIGGGGSILAIPLLLYFVGIDKPHLVIGTTALAVGINAYVNFIGHFRKHNVDKNVGLIFSIVGVVGVLVGTTLGLITPGESLIGIFSVLIIAIGLYMFLTKCKKCTQNKKSKKQRVNKKKVSIFSLIAGFASGYFGIGGGFLIVPSILYSSDTSINKAVGTSLLAVGTFGIVTAIRYAFAGDLIISIALLYVLGGIFGGILGTRITTSINKSLLRKIFAIIIIVVGIYMLVPFI
ncbi:MAG: sulfite exporter TauE/SafE family protein [Candidatus Parvarchaeum sp.]